MGAALVVGLAVVMVVGLLDGTTGAEGVVVVGMRLVDGLRLGCDAVGILLGTAVGGSVRSMPSRRRCSADLSKGLLRRLLKAADGCNNKHNSSADRRVVVNLIVIMVFTLCVCVRNNHPAKQQESGEGPPYFCRVGSSCRPNDSILLMRGTSVE